MYNIFMYIIELISKLIKGKKGKGDEKLNKQKNAPMPPEIDYEETCSHVFLPIDSTGETLACSKCGLIVKNDSSKYKPKNPFS